MAGALKSRYAIIAGKFARTGQDSKRKFNDKDAEGKSSVVSRQSAVSNIAIFQLNLELLMFRSPLWELKKPAFRQVF